MNSLVGTVVVNEVVLPIIDVRMLGGEIVLVGHRKGPLRAFAGGVTDIELFGTDGSAIGSVRANVPPWWDLGPEDTLTVPLPMRITEIVAVDAEGVIAETNSP